MAGNPRFALLPRGRFEKQAVKRGETPSFLRSRFFLPTRVHRRGVFYDPLSLGLRAFVQNIGETAAERGGTRRNAARHRHS